MLQKPPLQEITQNIRSFAPIPSGWMGFVAGMSQFAMAPPLFGIPRNRLPTRTFDNDAAQKSCVCNWSGDQAIGRGERR
jgi:hypothetical protein